MTAYLGVDGGGTKTAFAVVADDGAVLARDERESTYYLEGHGIGLVERVLRDGVAAVCARAGVAPGDLGYAFFALPGYGEVSGDVPLLDRAPHAALGHDRYRCGNDMVAGWAGSLALENGINVIAGTGSMAYGEHDGRGARAGGWGELFGDEGSGYWIGLRGLNAFSRMSDGREPRGPLHEAVRATLGVTKDLDVMDVVFNTWGKGRARIASLSPVVAGAAEAGDPVARQILETAGIELARLVGAVRDAVRFPGEATVAVSYSGGVFRAAAVRDAFADRLRTEGRYEVRRPVVPPVLGAALYAAKLAGAALPPDAVRRLREQTPA